MTTDPRPACGNESLHGCHGFGENDFCDGVYSDPDQCIHDWSLWEINEHFAAREDRFCSLCGCMETQTLDG